MKSIRDVQAQAYGFLPEVRRTIDDRRKIAADRPETAAALGPRIKELESLAEFLHELSFITYAEGDPPPSPDAPRP